MGVPLLDLKAQWATIGDEVKAAIEPVYESQYFINGPQVKQFEAEVAAYCGAKRAVGCASGSDALVLALLALDIGPETIELYCSEVAGAKTVVWNGPMGCFEMEPFAAGTFGICRAVADADCISVIGGGDSVSAVKKSGLADQMSHISTGGGASLEFMEGKALPGIVALSDNV